VKVAKGVEGVTSVSDKLHVRDSKETSVKGYAGDTAITSEVKPSCWPMILSFPQSES
jgi:hyperosmotically inducible protein